MATVIARQEQWPTTPRLFKAGLQKEENSLQQEDFDFENFP